MILITGGLGFVGTNTTQALLAVGEDCVLTYYNNARVPDLFKDQVGKRIFLERADVTDIDSLLAIGKKHRITGIVHLAGSFATGEYAAFEDIRTSMVGLANVLQMGHAWKVKRVSVASAPGVYAGITRIPWREDELLPLTAPFSLIAFKKAGEVFTSSIATTTGLDCISLRFAALYGPFYDATRGSLVGRLVHAAIHPETAPNLAGIRGSVFAADGADQCYSKDAARAVALLQTADSLNHHVYNIATGHPTTNQAIIHAIRQVIPDYTIELPAGHMPGGLETVSYQDITWLHADTGFHPQFSIETAAADYIAWLRAGNER